MGLFFFMKISEDWIEMGLAGFAEHLLYVMCFRSQGGLSEKDIHVQVKCVCYWERGSQICIISEKM